MIVPEPDRSAVEAEAQELGVDLEEIRENANGPTWSVTVVVDRDGGVDLDTLATLALRLDPLAEHWGPASKPVTLEVTSRGVDAPLTEPRHWKRARGRQVDLLFVEGLTGPERARVGDLDVQADTVRLVWRTGRTLRVESVPLTSVDRAVVRVEFRPAPDDEIALLGAESGSTIPPVGDTFEGE